MQNMFFSACYLVVCDILSLVFHVLPLLVQLQSNAKGSKQGTEQTETRQIGQ